MFLGLMVFLITLYSPGTHDDAYAEKGEYLMGNFMETAATSL